MGYGHRPGAQVAQLVEHATENRSVGGSIPPLGTMTSMGYVAPLAGRTTSGPLFRITGIPVSSPPTLFASLKKAPFPEGLRHLPVDRSPPPRITEDYQSGSDLLDLGDLDHVFPSDRLIL
jgi:hypothetical protein